MRIELDVYGIVLEIYVDEHGSRGPGFIYSDLKNGWDKPNKNYEFKAAMDAVESLILAHALAGVDVSHKDYVDGIVSAVDAIDHHYGD